MMRQEGCAALWKMRCSATSISSALPVSGSTRGTGSKQPDEDLASYPDWRIECIGGVDQHVVPVLDLALVLHPVGYEDGGEEEDEAALRGHRVVRVVEEPVLRVGASNSGSEPAVTGAAVCVTA